jgi:hypothetical protein
MLIVSAIALSWLGMMAIHELGHFVAAKATGGIVRQVVFHPLTFSRTDVDRNKSPLTVAWCGPIVGSLMPVLLMCGATLLKLRIAYLWMFFAGFCLLANGVYLGIGIFDSAGDAGDLLRHGAPTWMLISFGAMTVPPGFYLWHRASPQFRFGKSEAPVKNRDAQAMAVLAVIAVVLACCFGNRGG